MAWDVAFHDDFVVEFRAFDPSVQDGLLAVAKLLVDCGSQLDRLHVHTLNGSRHANRKELRFEGSGGKWRAAFAFDPGAAGDSAAGGDKVRRKPEALLPAAYRQGGFTV